MRNTKLQDQQNLALNCYTAMKGTNALPVLAVMSPTAGDGRTTVIMELLDGFAAMNLKVTALDLCFSDPALTARFRVSQPMTLHGLRTAPLQFLDTDKSGVRVVGITPGAPDLELITNGTELTKLFEKAVEGSDLVIVDTPPASNNHASFNIGEAAKNVLLVARSNYTASEQLKLTVARLRERNVEPIGMVMNDHRVHIPKVFAGFFE